MRGQEASVEGENVAIKQQEGELPSTKDLWEEIGFHKPLASFWYNFVFLMVDIVLGILMSGVFLQYLEPYPESNGYLTTAFGFFRLIFTAFDLGTYQTMDRYIAEARIKNPKRMLHYVQYFIWYQMITGLVQTTSVSVYAIFFARESDLAYLTWLMLIASTTQYPGFLGAFRGVLNSLQHFDKAATLKFIQGQLFERAIEISFILMGRWYGMTHPGVGEILGIAVGKAIGTYVDDFIGMAFSAYFFTQVMKGEGIRARDCFRTGFRGKGIFKECAIFGLKTGFPRVLSSFSSFYILLLYLAHVNQYTTWTALMTLAATPLWLINTAHPPMTPLYSEAFMNKKIKLTQYYLGQAWRYSSQIVLLFVSIFTILIWNGILYDAFSSFNLNYYLAALPFMIPLTIRKGIEPFLEQAVNVLVGTNKPNLVFLLQLFEIILSIFFMTCFIAWWDIPGRFSLPGIIFVMVFGEVIAVIVKVLIIYVYINKKLFKVKVPLYQTFVAPAGAALMSFFLTYIVKITVYDYFNDNFGFFVALPFLFVALFVISFILYFPFIGLLGGFDKTTLGYFRKVVKMSGPSKGMVTLIYAITSWMCKISPLHDKFVVDAAAAIQEAEELRAMKQSRLKKEG